LGCGGTGGGGGGGDWSICLIGCGGGGGDGGGERRGNPGGGGPVPAPKPAAPLPPPTIGMGYAIGGFKMPGTLGGENTRTTANGNSAEPATCDLGSKNSDDLPELSKQRPYTPIAGNFLAFDGAADTADYWFRTRGYGTALEILRVSYALSATAVTLGMANIVAPQLFAVEFGTGSATATTATGGAATGSSVAVSTTAAELGAGTGVAGTAVKIAIENIPEVEAEATAVVRGPTATRELAQQIANVENIPMRFNRTIAVVETAQGPTLVGGGASDLSAAQIAFARSVGLTPVPPMPGFHAEKTIIAGAGALGLTPTAGATSNIICSGPGGCSGFLQELGATVGKYTFSF
jgi:hypothetical protein